MPEKRILIDAENRKGHGIGHLMRCARIAGELSGEVDWLLPEKGGDGTLSRAEVRTLLGNVPIPVRWVNEPEGPYDIVIVDRRKLTLDRLLSYRTRGLVVGLDVGGEGRRYCSYVIDALPKESNIPLANISDPGLLPLPEETRTSWPVRLENALVVFGGEDGGRLAEKEIERVVSDQRFSDFRWSVVADPEFPLPAGVSRVTAHGNLASMLRQYDLVITHFGLTAFEALWSKVPVLLVHPTRYHQELAQVAAFPEIGFRGIDLEQLYQWTQKPRQLVQRCTAIRPSRRNSVTDFIESLHPPKVHECFVPWEEHAPAIERYADRSYFEDPSTGMVFAGGVRGVEVRYNHDYFFSEYRDQYGRTYLEDFEHIAEVGRRRAHDILRQCHGNPDRQRRLLDIGCAYGPFLKAAGDAGFSPVGVDVACEAVEYAGSQLGVPTFCGDILTMNLDTLKQYGPFDVVTMWYVIEHFPDLNLLFERINSLLRRGGLLAVSTPNGSGISGRSDRHEFLRRNPDDHFTIWSPESARKYVPRFGYHVRRIRVTGHHPERFPWVKGPEARPSWELARLWSRLRGLGDTFEFIAERVR